MKNVTLIVFFLLMFCNVNAQFGTAQILPNGIELKSGKDNDDSEASTEVKVNLPKSIISTSAEIRTYHTDKALREMSKGMLIDLYIEHLKVVVKKVPRIALATRPGVTMIDLGIPDSLENRRVLEIEDEATEAYLESSIGFLKNMLAYADKERLVTMVLFYEQMMKSLREVGQ